MNGAQMCVNVTLINKKEKKKFREKLFHLAPNGYQMQQFRQKHYITSASLK
jgi:hypothetical protein